MWLWGGTGNGKLGFGDPKTVKTDQKEPQLMEYFEKEDENDREVLVPYIIRSEEGRPRGNKWCRKFKSAQFGQDHGLLLDLKGRLYGMGRTRFGRLGLHEEDIEDEIYIPTRISFNLPEPNTINRIADIRCGQTHSMAISRQGELYSWGEGENCRLGLGFIEETHSTPN